MNYKRKLFLLKNELSRVSRFVVAKYRYFKQKKIESKSDLISIIIDLKSSILIYKKLLRVYKKELLIQNRIKYYNALENSYKATKLGSLSLSLNNPIFSSISHLQNLKLYFEQSEEYEKCNIVYARILKIKN